MHRRRHIQYERQTNENDRSETDSAESLLFEKKKPKPYKTILMAIFMFVAGVSSLLFSALIYLGTFDEKYEDRMVPALIIGSVMFIPGVYYTFLFILILLKVPGYSYEIFERFE